MSMRSRSVATITFAIGLLATGALASPALGQTPITLQGAGATFPAPLYQRWFQELGKTNPGIRVNYQPVGSGAGIKQFTEGLVQFGASDAAMTDEQIAQVKSGVVLLPMTAGSIVLAYNVPGVAELKLSRAAYTDIFLGKVRKWNDAAIAAANPGVTLPDTPITVVSRSDGSGTTYVFSNHLAAVSEAWKSGPGVGTSVQFPVGVGGKGNAGVTALIKQTPGAIGYVEFGYAEQTKMPMAVLENRSGKYVKADLASAQAALADVKLPPDLRAWIPDPAGAAAYPIVTYTWLLCYKQYADASVASALKTVIRYGLTDGQKLSGELGYVPLPDAVAKTVLDAAGTIAP
ncbi:phosphate ABC transporter substrate-binding protein PstS [Candidatus Binatia bacterium]|nr:phosphate ABC transporter substrate-binding protein PstS [Candidatus Binatia bacterium]